MQSCAQGKSKQQKACDVKAQAWEDENEGVRVNLQSNHAVIRCGHYKGLGICHLSGKT
jgi:hypothetical protein